MSEVKCKYCCSEITGNYCSNCGKPVELQRIDKKYIWHEIVSVLNFDKGILFSIKELVIRPGKSIRDFIVHDRNRLVKPVIFIILTSLIYTLINQIFGFEDNYINYQNSNETTVAILFGWVQKNYGYANIIMGLAIALWCKILFRKNGYNYFEILILLCFVMGIGMLIFSIFGIIEGVTGYKLMSISGLLGTIYISWAIGQFFDGRKPIAYIKAIISYLLGMLTFIFTIIGTGMLVDLLMKS